MSLITQQRIEHELNALMPSILPRAISGELSRDKVICLSQSAFLDGFILTGNQEHSKCRCQVDQAKKSATATNWGGP